MGVYEEITRDGTADFVTTELAFEVAERKIAEEEEAARARKRRRAEPRSGQSLSTSSPLPCMRFSAVPARRRP